MILKRWKDTGKISYKKLSIRKYLYDVDSVFIGADNKTLHDRFNVVYPCVSNTKQQDDLQRQIQLRRRFPKRVDRRLDCNYTSLLNENVQQ